MRGRLPVLGLLTALVMSVVATAAVAASVAVDPRDVEAAPVGTCFEGATAAADCSTAESFARDSQLADGAQIAQILAAGGVSTDEDCSALYLSNQIVTRMSAATFNKTYQPQGRYGVSITGKGDPVPAGFYSFRIAGGGHDALSFVQALYEAQLSGDGPRAVGYVAPIYVLTGAPVSKGGPGTMPLPAATPSPPPVVLGAGHDLIVFDTDPGKLDVSPQDGFVDAIAGHGDFVSGIAESVYTGSVELVDATTSGGVFTEAQVALVMSSYPYSADDVVNLSAGTYACTADGGSVKIEPMLLAHVVETIHQAKADLVAAAGNDATKEEFYPAAYGVRATPVSGPCTNPEPATAQCRSDFSDAVTSVGSLNTQPKGLVSYATPKSAERSSFSNFGDWVEAWALGEGLVSDHPGGAYSYCVPLQGKCAAPGGGAIDPGDAPAAHLGSLVQWSGTSFATPQVAAWIAAGNSAP